MIRSIKIRTHYLLFLLPIFFVACGKQKERYYERAVDILRDTVLLTADRHLAEKPLTVTASTCPRSQGGIHDFYSEGDYWWPDTLNPEGPYVRRDGMTNPDNFTDHRKALMRFSEIVGNLGSAYLITKDSRYAEAALTHCTAWFVEESTRMNPHLLYAQAIQGRHTGRGIGIIDAIHFMEVVQALRVFEAYGAVESKKMEQIRDWFQAFLEWLTTHPYGQDEMVHPNNHGTCWNMQVGVYALFTENDSILDFCRENYKNTLLPNQMGVDGSFPLEMERTKPYGYALFNLDAMTMNCLILSDPSQNLWTYTTTDGKSILKGLEYMQPFVADKSIWPLEPDVMYWEQWPVAHPAFIFGSVYFERDDFFAVWAANRHFLEVEEVKRNVPIRNPLLWMDRL